MEIAFIDVVDYLGTFAFAVSGIRLASAKKFDLFGAFVVGFVTAIGGGTVRDLLLGVTPFWMLVSSYIVVTTIALIVVAILGKYVIRMHNTIFVFDAIGLGLFTVVGIERTLALDFPFWVAVIMGVVTGSVGGIIRDTLINEIPLIFRKDIYAMASVVGGLIYLFCSYGMQLPPVLVSIISACAVIATRVVAVKFHLGLPVLNEKYLEKNKNN